MESNALRNASRKLWDTRAVGRLDGRRALITGASGGIGTAIARAFAAEGAQLVVAGRRSQALDELVAEAGSGFSVVFDVADSAAAAEGVDRAAELLGGLDTLVCAAAIDCEWSPVGKLSVESWDETIATNLSGAFYVCRAALPHLVAAGSASIVNVSSVAGYTVWPEDAAYAVSKAGLDLLTRTIAVEYGARGVRANCVSPGVIDAGMTDLISDPAERTRLAELHPIPRLGLAEEVAEAAVWLASDASSFTTGSVVRVDGGFLDRWR